MEMHVHEMHRSFFAEGTLSIFFCHIRTPVLSHTPLAEQCYSTTCTIFAGYLPALHLAACSELCGLTVSCSQRRLGCTRPWATSGSPSASCR